MREAEDVMPDDPAGDPNPYRVAYDAANAAWESALRTFRHAARRHRRTGPDYEAAAANFRLAGEHAHAVERQYLAWFEDHQP